MNLEANTNTLFMIIGDLEVTKRVQWSRIQELEQQLAQLMPAPGEEAPATPQPSINGEVGIPKQVISNDI